MLIIHYGTSLKAIDTYIDKYNAECTPSEMVRKGVRYTAKEIVRVYGEALKKANKIRPLDLCNIPPLSTNNVHIGKLTNSSSRTAQRHVKRLIEIGIIIDKKWHGTKANYELWITDEILLIKQRIKQEETEIALIKSFLEPAEKQPVKNDKRTKYPHRESSNKNNLLIAVCNSTDRTAFESSEVGERFLGSGYTEEKLCAFLRGVKKIDSKVVSKKTIESERKGFSKKEKEKNCAQKEKETMEDTEGKQVRAGKSSSKIVSETDARTDSLNLYTDLLWSMAKNTIYSDRSLSNWQQGIAKELIRKLYEPVRTESLYKVHAHYVARIAWQWHCIKRQPNKRFVQLPHQYFNTNNPNGFVGTKKHYLKDEIRKRN